jgi:TIR domain
LAAKFAAIAEIGFMYDGVATMPAEILAYFSHSYKAEDREVNSFFWELFSDAGYFFTVDPKSNVFSIPYLESMMLRSNCFVAVIPRRPASPLGCSPYILFEYGLAKEAQKPLLVFVERDVNSEWFERDSTRVIPFNRQRLQSNRDRFKEAIEELAQRVRGEPNPDTRLRRPCGLLIQSGDTQQVYPPEVVQRLDAELRKYGRKLRVVSTDFDASFLFSLQLEEYDFLLTDVRDSLHVPWLAGYVLGRAMPTIKVCHLQPGEQAESVTLPAIIARHKPQGTTETAVEYWHDIDELLQRVGVHVSKFNNERIEFHSKDEGVRYFSRAGRSDAGVFVSNASISNPLAHGLITELQRESINFFHYQVKDAIPTGDRWLQKLEAEIEGAGLFVALLTMEFLKSQWCLYELQVARKRVAEGKLKILPYVLDETVWPMLAAAGLAEFEARDCTRQQPEAAIAEITRDLDRELRAGPRTGGLQAPAPAAATAGAAEVVLKEEDRRELVAILTARLTPEDARPAWVKGLLIRALLYAPLAGEDYSGSAQAVATTLVTRAEAIGVLVNGDRAITKLVRGLCKEERVTQSALPFLTALADRLERGAGD